MIQIKHCRATDLSANKVWAEMRHYDRVLAWIPGGDTSSIKITGKGVGMIRDIELSTQGYAQHRLVAFDDKERTFSYTLTAGQPIGMKEYTVVAKVTPIDSGHCTICWTGNMTSDNSLNEYSIGIALETALGNMTTGIIALIKGETPVFVAQPNEDWQLQKTQKS